MKDYLEKLRAIDREALQAKAAVLVQNAGMYADEAKDVIGEMTDYSMEKVHGFSVLDVAIFKVCLMSFGLWLGVQFANFFKKWKPVILVGFILSYAYLIWRMFFAQDS